MHKQLSEFTYLKDKLRPSVNAVDMKPKSEALMAEW